MKEEKKTRENKEAETTRIFRNFLIMYFMIFFFFFKLAWIFFTGCLTTKQRDAMRSDNITYIFLREKMNNKGRIIKFGQIVVVE